MSQHRISLARPDHRFSCAHMTVFPDGTKERLHGHNYTIGVALEVERVEFAAMIPFAAIKGALTALCNDWREHVLIARYNPHLELMREDAEIELRLCGARYVFPRADVLVLPIDNISVEALAAHAALLLRERLVVVLEPPHVTSIEVTIEESPGQGASCKLEL